MAYEVLILKAMKRNPPPTNGFLDLKIQRRFINCASLFVVDGGINDDAELQNTDDDYSNMAFGACFERNRRIILGFTQIAGVLFGR